MKNNKTKKWLIVTGGLIISVALIVMISNEFKTPPVEDVEIPSASSESQDVVVEKPKDDFVVPPIVIPDKEPETTNGDDEGTEQTIQPDPPKKPEPTEEELTDKTQTPSGEKVELPTTPDEKPVAPTPPPTEPSNPSGGLPGFDNVPDMGEGEVEHLDDMYENGNKVGIMD